MCQRTDEELIMYLKHKNCNNKITPEIFNDLDISNVVAPISQDDQRPSTDSQDHDHNHDHQQLEMKKIKTYIYICASFLHLNFAVVYKFICIRFSNSCVVKHVVQ